MHSTSNEPAVPSVKLFPRLAMTRPSQRLNRATRLPAAARRRSADVDQQLETPHTQVRARLLRMILENERARRNEERPTAG